MNEREIEGETVTDRLGEREGKRGRERRRKGGKERETERTRRSKQRENKAFTKGQRRKAQACVYTIVAVWVIGHSESKGR